MKKVFSDLLIIGISLLTLSSIMIVFNLSNPLLTKPALLGWGTAVLGLALFYILSVRFNLKNKKFHLMFDLTGSALRFFMTGVVLLSLVFFKKNWLMPFALSYLSCFLIFISFEIYILNKSQIRI